MNKYQDEMPAVIDEYKKATEGIPNVGLGAELKVISALKVSNTILQAMEDLEQNPYELLIPVMKAEARLLSTIHFDEERLGKDTTAAGSEGVEATKKLYENIWTIYNNETYDHSMQLCLQRYKANGFDESYFSGKSVFDGGCGTGRFCIAAALLGAEKVYGMDLGGLSLAFAREKAIEYDVADRVEFIEGDVTSLDRFQDASVDFVVSNGVLHHTSDPIKGLGEHYRIMKNNGALWLYLYGKHALDFSRTLLLRRDVRQGMIYSFMDNVFAPIRNYYNTSSIFKELEKFGPFSSKPMRGIGYLDDSVLQNDSGFGKTLLGEECEVRQIIKKIV